jgi:predicted HAD superfamily Cof-like phosphohydrolase
MDESSTTRVDIMTNFEKVKEFMSSFRQEVKDSPKLAEHEIAMLRLKLILEEYEELEDAVTEKHLVGIADALTDILYVTYGAGAAYGIDLDKCFEEVHSSNMSKLGEDGNPIYREDGKVLKGPNYRPPDLKNVLGV